MRDDVRTDSVSPYRAPPWLVGGHAQTIWPYLLRVPRISFRRERVETDDGRFLGLRLARWVRIARCAGRRAVSRPRGQRAVALRACAVRAPRRHRLARRRAAFPRMQR